MAARANQSMTRAAFIVAVSAVAAGALSTATGQTPVFKGAVDLVRLDVSVMRGGQPVRDLTARDFSIVDNGVPQVVESVVAMDELPVSVAIVLDTSGSVAGNKLAHLVDADKGLLASLRPDDRAALLTFSQEVRARVPLTVERATIQSAMASLKGDGPTAIHDAVWTALQLRVEPDTRPLILLFTDGVDNASWISASDVVEGARRLGIVIHIVELRGAFTDAQRVRVKPLVEKLADVTGGRQWSATSSRELRQLFTRAIDEMRARYVVTFYPTNAKREGWYDLSVRVDVRGDVRTRPGYFVPSP